jgi:hypothetical protein
MKNSRRRSQCHKIKLSIQVKYAYPVRVTADCSQVAGKSIPIGMQWLTHSLFYFRIGWQRQDFFCLYLFAWALLCCTCACTDISHSPVGSTLRWIIFLFRGVNIWFVLAIILHVFSCYTIFWRRAKFKVRLRSAFRIILSSPFCSMFRFISVSSYNIKYSPIHLYVQVHYRQP